jgi:two-component system LytT family sensor kinase
MTAMKDNSKTIARSFLWSFTAATLMGGFFAATTLFNTPEGKPSPSFSGLLIWNFVAFYIWAALFPAIKEVCRRYRLEDRPNFSRNLPIHIVSAVLFMGVHLITFVSIQWIVGSPRVAKLGAYDKLLEYYMRALMDTQVIVYLSILAGAHMINYYRRYRNEELRASNLRSELAELNLQSLRMQLNPHFLFNTLNVITELIHKDPDAAERMVMTLSDLLRSSLASSNEQKIPLSKELEFVEQYLAIQKMRFGDRLTVVKEIEPGLENALVPNMLLQPLVENAVQHGIAPSIDGGAVMLHAFSSAGRITLEVIDTGVGFCANGETIALESSNTFSHGSSQPAKLHESMAYAGTAGLLSPAIGSDISHQTISVATEDCHKKHHGIGLTNTRARLQELYGSKHTFRIENNPLGGVRISIEIPAE